MNDEWPGDEWPGTEDQGQSQDQPAPQAAAQETNQWPGQEWPGTEDARPQPEGELKTFGREAAHAVLPTAGGMVTAGAGAAAGAAVGSVAGPVGTAAGGIVGGIAGMILGSMATDKVQDYGLEQLGFDDSQQRAANIQENPKSAFAGGLAPALATMSPAGGAKAVERVAGAGLMGGFEAGQEAYNGDGLDPFKIGGAAAAGAVAPRPNRVGEKLFGLSGKIAGRPNTEANPSAVPAQDEAASSQQATVTGESSLQQPAPTTDGATTGNPQSAPTRSSRKYPKGETAAPQNGGDPLTTGDYAPDVAQALQTAQTGEGATVPPDKSWLAEPPAGGNKEPQTTVSEPNLPIDTGIEAAAQRQPSEGPQPISDTGIEAGAQPPPAEAPPPTIGEFKTAKGSQYAMHPDGTTTRNKAARAEHPGDEGPKPRSEKTYYLTPEQANALAPAQGKFRLIDHGDGTLSMAQPGPGGRWGIAPSQRAVPFSTEPKEGLHPLEAWSGQQGKKGGTAYNAIHFGNTISELGQNGPRRRMPVQSEEGLIEASRMQREAAEKASKGQGTLPDSEWPGTKMPGEDHPSEKIKAVADQVNTEPSEAQVNAENYQKAPVRMHGRLVKIENPEGSIRRSKPGAAEPWEVKMPYDYGDIKGTKGADGDNIDIAVGKGDRHFIIDQKDANTGKFDEHKVFSHFKDAADAVDHYERGFSDAKGSDRLMSIKEVGEQELKDWLAKPGAKKIPYSEEVGAKVTAPAEGVKPEPKIVTAAVKKLQDMGKSELAAKLMEMDPSKRLGAASKIVNETTKDLARPDRIRGEAPIVEGIKSDAGEPITARDKGDAARKSADVKTMNDAYAKLGPLDLPKTPEEKAAARARVQAFADETKAVKYRPAVKHAPYLMAKAARKLLLAKNPTDKSWLDFAATAKTLEGGGEREVRQEGRAEADIGRSRRTGDEAVSNAEAANAAKSSGRNEIEDAMLEAIDAKRGYIDVPHEEAEEMVKPEPVRTRADLKAEGKNHIDITTPEGQTKLVDALGAEPAKGTPEKVAAKQQTVAEKEAIEKANALAESKNRTKDLLAQNKAALNKKYADMLAQAEAKSKAREAPEALPADPRDLKKGGPKDLFEKFMNDERGSLNIDRIMGDLMDWMEKMRTPKPSASHVARTPKSMQEEYAHSLSTDLHGIRQDDIEHKLQLLKWEQNLPKELNNPEVREQIYRAREEGKLGLLPPDVKALYDEHLKPMFDENDTFFDNIAKIDPGRIGPEVADHIYRILKGNDPEHNILHTGESKDPIEGVNAITTAARGPALARRFVALERSDGKRFVISLDDGGFKIWKNGSAQTVEDPGFSFKAGNKYKVGNTDFTMKEAMTPEIEQHARGDDGKKLQYYKNAPLSAAATNSYLGSMARHLQYLNNLKSDPEFLKMARPPGAKSVPAEYRDTSLPNFKGWKMDPQLAYVMDDFAQAGFNEPSLNMARKLAQAVTKTIFWLPTAHINNVGAHWFVERGWNWLPGTGGYRSLAVNGAKAIRSVITQDALQSELRASRAGTIYGGILTQGFMEQLGKGVGEAIKNDKPRWDPIARTLGVGPSDLAKAIYKGSSKVMWAANDMLLTQAVLENMSHGLSMKDAIVHAERHIPNYRVPATIMGSGKGARLFSQIMQEPTFFAFGRYHYGVFNSYAHMVKDLVKGSGSQRLEAIGNLMALGILSYAIYPALDAAYQGLTGNPDASAQRRGPMSIPHHLARAAEGKEDIMQAGRSTLTMAPALATALETLNNKDFRGKQIIEPGDVRAAAHGSGSAAARVGVQATEHAARGLVSPIGTAEMAYGKGAGVGSTLRDQLLDIRNPSPQSRKYEATIAKTSTQKAVSRFKKPPGMLEGTLNKITGY